MQQSNTLARNSIALTIRMVIRLLISLYTTRVILDALGVADYGIYNVIAGLSAMFSFVNSSMSNAISRFLSYALGQGKCNTDLERTFKLSFTAQFSLAICAFILAEIIGVPIINNVLSIPSDRMLAANILYQCTLVGFIANILQIPFNATIVAFERMTAYAYIEIVYVSLLLLIAMSLKLSFGDRLILYGFLVATINIIIFFCYYFYCRRFGICKVGLLWSRNEIKPILTFSVSDMYANICLSLQNQGQNIILNRFFGVAVNAAAGIASQIYGAMLMYTNSITTAIRPQIIKSYSSGDIQKMTHLMIDGSRILSFATISICVPVLIRLRVIVALWLSNPPTLTIVFASILLINHCLFCHKTLYIIGLQATGKIGKFSFISGSWYLIGIGIQLIMALIGLNQTYIFGIIVLLSFVNTIIILYYLNQYIPLPFGKVIFVFFTSPLITLALSYGISYGISCLFTEKIIASIIVMLASAIITFSLGSFIILNKVTRSYLINQIKSIYQAFRKRISI